MSNNEMAVRQLSLLIQQLRFDEALSLFYSDDIVAVENEELPVTGFEYYKIASKLFIDNITDYSAELKNVIIEGNITVAVWHYKFQHKLWGNWDKVQVSVQRWENGKIVHERHHYETKNCITP